MVPTTNHFVYFVAFVALATCGIAGAAAGGVDGVDTRQQGAPPPSPAPPIVLERISPRSVPINASVAPNKGGDASTAASAASTGAARGEGDDVRSKPPRTVRWYLRVSDGDFETTNLDFVDSAADALNGVYLCCGEMYVNAEGQYVQARSDAALAALVLPYLQRGLDTWLVLGAAYQAINSGRAMAAIPDIAAVADQLSLAGVMVDYEPGNDNSNGHFLRYQAFLQALSDALHATPSWVDAGACLASWSIIGERFFSGYAEVTTVDTYMLMGTYNASGLPTPRSDAQAALDAGISTYALAAGVGSMVQAGAEWDYRWTKESLVSFLTWASAQGIREVDVWRADIDHMEVGNTEPWFVEAIADYLGQRL